MEKTVNSLTDKTMQDLIRFEWIDEQGVCIGSAALSSQLDTDHGACYLVLPDTKKIILTSVSSDDIEKMGTILDDIGMGELQLLIADLCDKKLAGQISFQDERILGCATFIFLRKTQTYQKWLVNFDANFPSSKMHAMILIYRRMTPVGQEGLLRPVMINSEASFIHPADIIDAATKVMDQDIKRNPKWFE